MRIFNLYIGKNLLGTLLLALGILTFVMMSVHLFRLFALLASGVSPAVLGKIFLCYFPNVLRYALPFSTLVSTVLVFSRMSADNEIVALKASGIGLWQITAPALVLTLILCAAGVWLAMDLSPRLRYAGERIRWQAVTTSPLALLEPGAITNLSGQTSIRVGSRDPESGLLQDVHIYQLDKNGDALQEITARACRIEAEPEERTLHLTLYHFSIAKRAVSPETLEKQRDATRQAPDFLTGETLTLQLEYGTLQDRKTLGRMIKMMPVKMLLADLIWQRSQGKDVSKYWYDFHYRLALAFSPLAFLLMGIPFGIRNRRSEAASGLVICLALALVYYGVILLCDSLVKHPELHPEYLIWLPNLLYQVGGLFALARLARH